MTKNKTLGKFIVVLGIIMSFSCTNRQPATYQSSDSGDTIITEIREEIPNVRVSNFKFPTEKIADKSANMYEALGLLYGYFTDDLQWKYSKECLEYGNFDEESNWRQRSIRLSTNKLTFDDGIQLFYNIYLDNKKLNIKHNSLFNNDLKIWYAVFKTKEKFEDAEEQQVITFCRVIEKNNYIQLIVDYDYWRDYDEITKYINKIIKNRNYHDAIWEQEISQEKQFFINEKNL